MKNVRDAHQTMQGKAPMNGTRFFKLCLWFLLAAIALSTTHADPRPNIIFIAIDDLRPELGCYGSTTVKSPVMDGLASEGLLFNRAYCQQAICGAARRCIVDYSIL